MFILILIIICLAGYWLFAPPSPKNKRREHNRIDLNELNTDIFNNRINAVNEAIALGKDVDIRYEKRDGTITRRCGGPPRRQTVPVRLLRNQHHPLRKVRRAIEVHCEHAGPADRSGPFTCSSASAATDIGQQKRFRSARWK